MTDTTAGSSEARLAPPADRAGVSGAGRRRLLGIDVARAVAFGGMLLAHYASPEEGADDPGWLRAVDAAADGRAAPLFCVLLGLSAGLVVARGARDREFVVRGALLVAVGFFVWPYAQAVSLILPHYGLLLMAVPLLRRVPDRLLVPGAIVAFSIPTVAAALMGDDRIRSSPQPDSWGDLLDGYGFGVVRLLTWTGAYPVVGWVGFVLIGLWLARRPLGVRATQLRLLVGGAAIALVQPLVAALIDVPADPTPGIAEGWDAVLDTTAHANRFGWYVVASATAVAVIAACLLVVDRRARGRITPLVALGQCALSAYLAHLVIGAELVWPWQDRAEPSLAAQIGVTLIVYVSFAVLATLWRRHHTHGPAEEALRAGVALVR